jgi:cytochrome c
MSSTLIPFPNFPLASKGSMLNKITLLVAAFAAASTASPTFTSPALAEKSGCMGCHQLDKKLVGPGFAQVATKYAGQKDAEAKLIVSIKAGGAGKWGSIPMPASGNVSDADISTLAAWVLTTGK